MNVRGLSMISAALILPLLSCSPSSPTAGGTGEETTNGICVAVRTPDGKAVRGAAAYLIDAGNWQSLVASGHSVVLDSSISDSGGHVRFEGVGAGGYNVTVMLDSQASVCRNVVPGDQVVDTATLRQSATYAGTIAVDTGATSQLFVGGTQFAARVDNGSFVIPLLPPGTHALFVQIDLAGVVDLAYAGSVVLSAAQRVTGGVVEAIYRGLLLDNFDDGDRNSLLNAVTGTSYWYARNDADLGGKSILTPAGVLTDFARAIVGGTDGFDSLSARLSVVLDTGITKPYGSFECFVNPAQDSFADLSSLESISFYAKGRGTFRMNCVSRKIHRDFPTQYAGCDLGVTIPCPAAWTRVSVNVTDLAPPPGSPPGIDSLRWSGVMNAVNKIVFGSWGNPGDTVELFLDDIELHGVDISIFR